MQLIISEINRALSLGLYYLALMMTLSLPDICAALESSDGQTSGAKYKAWYNAWMASEYPRLTADDCYRIRCGVVHQGRFGHPQMQYARVLFTVPNAQGNVFHNNILNDALNLDVVTFCNDMERGISQWYQEKQGNSNVVANIPRLVQYREKGLAPYMVGIPLIT